MHVLLLRVLQVLQRKGACCVWLGGWVEACEATQQAGERAPHRHSPPASQDDKSNWGMFNRFCPWAPCAEPQVKEAEIPQFLVNPLTEKDNASSLFGA